MARTTPPVLASYVEIPYASGGTTLVSPTVTWSPNDLIVVIAGSANGSAISTPTATGLVFTPSKTSAVASSCAAWTGGARAAAAGSTTISIVVGATPSGAGIWVFSGSEGIGSSTLPTPTTAKTATMSPQDVRSSYIYSTFDWNADAVTDSLSPTPTNVREAAAAGANYTVFSGDLLDRLASTSFTFGIAGGSAVVGPFTIVGLEVLGTSCPTLSPFNQGVRRRRGPVNFPRTFKASRISSDLPGSGPVTTPITLTATQGTSIAIPRDLSKQVVLGTGGVTNVGRSTAKSITVSQSGAVGIVRSVSRIVSIAQVSSVSIAASYTFGKIVSTTVGAVASITKQAGAIRGATQTSAVTRKGVVGVVRAVAESVSSAIVRLDRVTVQVAPGSSATTIKQAQLPRGVSSGSVASLLRRAGRTFAASLGSSVSLPQRAIGKLVTAASTMLPTVATARAYLISLLATQGTTTTSVRRTGAIRQAGQSVAAAMGRGISRSTIVAQPTSGVVGRRTARGFLSTQASAASFVAQNVVLRTLTAVVGTATIVGRRAGVVRSATLTSLASRLTQTSRSFAVQQAITGLVAKQARVSKSATSTSSASLISGAVKTLILLATQGTSANIKRVISRSLMATQPTIALIGRGTRKILSVIVGSVSSLNSARVFLLTLTAQVSSIPSIVKHKILLVATYVVLGSTRVEDKKHQTKVLGRSSMSRARSIRKR